MSTVAISTLLEKYTLLSDDDLPSDPDAQKATVIAETIRSAIYYNRNSAGKIIPTRTTHILKWVKRKLRSVIPELRDDRWEYFWEEKGEDSDAEIKNMISDDYSPSLEFMGDIVRLGDGTFLPSPSRVIPLNHSQYILVSGIPTREFVLRGVNVQVDRTIRRIKPSLPITAYAPTQCLDSYLELNRFNYEQSHIEYLFETSQQIDWPPTPSKKFEGYSGFLPGRQRKSGSTGHYGFKNWSDDAVEVAFNGNRVSLWREELYWGRNVYWLKIKHKLPHTRVEQNYRDGRLVNEIKEHELKSIKVPYEIYRLVALEIDTYIGSKRGIEIFSDGFSTRLAIGFMPPDALRRWLFACGSRFSGYENGLMIWSIKEWAIGETERIAKLLKIHSEINVGE